LQLVAVSLTVKMTVNTFCTEQLCWPFELSTLSDSIACIASVSARICRERWDESKKKKRKEGGGEGSEGNACRKPHDFKKLRSPMNAAFDWCGAGSVD